MRLRVAPLLTLLLACGGEEAPSTQADEAAAPCLNEKCDRGGETPDAGAEICYAQMTWLQKDAYKEVSGPRNPLWPPHTTTTLSVYCDETLITEVINPNHGTRPEDVDAAGALLLVEVKTAQVEGARGALLELATAFETCACETRFLTMDDLRDEAVTVMVEALATYAATYLTCPEGLEPSALLLSGELEVLLEGLAHCTWAEGASWEAGFNSALATQLQEGLALSDYHVCNNDAALQAALWSRFVDEDEASVCDGLQALCHSPRWFYQP
ncbi:hypothetical protein KKF91_07385 [Myxococcota bacterium]|nr:hypothetical protein [Myxococcota bacterium]